MALILKVKMKGKVLIMSEEKKQELKENKGEVAVENAENNIQISDDVVAVIAGMAASEVPGVADMAGGFAGGISEVLSGKKNLSKGIKVDVTDKSTKIDVNIIVEYGARIPEVAFEIQKRVKKSVENMTGLDVEEVNGQVQGVSTKTESKKAHSEKKETEKEVKQEKVEVQGVSTAREDKKSVKKEETDTKQDKENDKKVEDKKVDVKKSTSTKNTGKKTVTKKTTKK